MVPATFGKPEPSNALPTKTIRFTVELEMQPPMHGWKPYNP